MNLYTRRTAVVSLGAALAAGLTAPADARDADVRRPTGSAPLRRAHAHNDYEHSRPLLEAEWVRHAFYDGRIEDLGTAAPASFAPLVSASWTETFRWQGVGPMPGDERERLRRLVAAAYDERRRLRFWATPDTAGPAREAVWTALLDAGVDHLKSDDLPGLEGFLRAER
ncbi:hypothetical protein [Streptomyces sirii]|uniref:hypothetical protein n=1 Tax=Streptomyces sirii TaxID=3127701 RepID=UPI003D36481E